MSILTIYKDFLRSFAVFLLLLSGCGTDDSDTTSNAANPSSSSPTSSIGNVNNKPIETAQTPELADSNMVVDDEITALDQVSNVSGSFGVSESGAATYRFPIASPLATAGVAPQISLVYNSQMSGGQVGRGWSVSGVSAISRCRQTLLQDSETLPITWSETDRFCLNGERLLLQSGEYGAPESTYQTEIDRYITVTAKGGELGHPDYFELTAKDGSLTVFGELGDSHAETASYEGTVKRADRVLKWSISRFEDSVGNPITYHYTDTANTHYLKKIQYGYGAEVGAGMSMLFDYDDAANPATGYVAGSRFTHSGRLASVEVVNELSQQTLRLYDFIYEDDKLTAIRACKEAVCLPEMEIRYDGVGVDFQRAEVTLLETDQFLGHKVLDVNGDGLQDLIWITGDKTSQKISHRAGKPIVGQGHDRQIATFNIAPTDESRLIKIEVIDYNADGRQDVFVYNPIVTADRRWQLYLASPTDDGDWSLKATSVYLPVSTPDIHFSDVNGDGLMDFYYFSGVDFIKVHHLQKSTHSASSESLYQYQTSERASLVLLPWHRTPDIEEDTQVGELKVDGFGDFNGDGQTDIILSFIYYTPCNCPGDTNPQPTGAKVAYVRDGASLTFYHKFQQGTYTTKLVDLNQDGLSDVVFSGFYKRNWFYHISTGHGLQARVEIKKDLIDTAPKLLDIDADGNVDFVWADGSRFQMMSWDAGKETFLSVDGGLLTTVVDVAIENNTNNNSAYEFMDFTGDGALDLMYLDQENDQLKIKPGTAHFHFNKATSFIDSFGNTTEIDYRPLNYSNHYTSVENVNTSRATRTQCYTRYRGAGDPGIEVCDEVVVSAIDAEDFYTQINDPFAKYEGKTLTDNDTAPLLELVGPTSVVTTVTTSAPTAEDPQGTQGVSYFYHHARFQAGGRGALGFQKVSKVNLQTGLMTTTQYRQDWPFLGYPEKVTVTTAEGQVLSESVSTADLIGYENLSADEWAEKRRLAQEEGTQALGPLKRYTSFVEKMTYDLVDDGVTQGGLVTQVDTQTAQDAYGNVTQSTMTYYQGDVPVGMTTTINDYGTDPWDLRYGRLKSSQVDFDRFDDHVAGAASITRSVEFGYYGRDGDCANSGLGQHEGLLCRETRITDTNLALTTYHFYDDFGNKTFTQTTGANEETRFSAFSQYDARGRFVDQVYDVFHSGLTATSTTPSDYYNSHVHGAIVKVSQVNSRDVYGTATQSTSYLDGNNRSAVVTQTQATSPFGKPYFSADSTGTYEITLVSKASNEHCPAITAYHTIERSAGGSERYRCFDPLGREIRSVAQGFKAGQWVYADTQYNHLGQVARSSQPYLAGNTVHWNRFEYDLLGRQTHTYRNVNGVEELSETQYAGLTTTYINAKQQSRSETHNAFGDLVTVTNSEGSAHYKYNANGDLAQLDDAGQNVTTIKFDDLGNKIRMEDPSKGDWTYRYNSFGQIVCQQDAKRQAIVNQHDMNGRLIKRTDHAAGGSCDDLTSLGAVVSETQWEYDTAQYGLGQLNTVSDLTSGYRESVRYDSLGRASVSDTYIPSGPGQGSHFQKTTYDHLGRVHMRYDAARDGEQFGDNGVLHQYNERGFLTQLKDGFSGASYFEIQAMDAYGNATETLLGNGVQQSNRYYQDTGFAQYFRAHTGAGDLTRLNMTWDKVGNLDDREVIHQRGREFEDFGYDELNRLKDYDVSEQENVDVVYNHLGNVTSKSDVQNGATYQYQTNGAGPYAVSQIGDIEYHYDANGNLERDDRNRNFQYTVFDKVERIEQDTRRVRYAYSPNRDRYQRIDEDTQSGRQNTTYYLGSVEKTHSASGKVQWKRTIGGVVQITQTVNTAKQITAEEAVYFHKDHLGSINLITDHNGLVKDTMAFDPWGARRNLSWKNLTRTEVLASWWMNEEATTLRGFTGHEMVDGVDVVNMNGRIYDAHLGRFLQADPIVQAPNLIGSMNRYSYVFNNPLNATDPTGYYSWGDFWDDVKPFVGAIVGVALSVWAPWAAEVWAPMVIGMIAGGSQAAANGGNVIMGMAFGAITGSVAVGGIGWESTLMSGLVGGGISVMMGGKFGYGFVAGSVGTMIGGQIGNPVGRIVASAALGGTITEMTGGKFKNGAASAAFAAMIGEVGRAYRGPIKGGGAGDSAADDTHEGTAPIEQRAKIIAREIGLPDADYDVRFSSTKEIKSVTKGQLAWGTVTKENGRWTILIEKSLSTEMTGARFTQTLAEELVHVEQLSSGYYKRLSSDVRRFALESEATGWVISHSSNLGLKGSAFKDFKKVHDMWEGKWRKSVY